MRPFHSLFVILALGSLLFFLLACNCRFLSGEEDSTVENGSQTFEESSLSQNDQSLVWLGTGSETLRVFSTFNSEDAIEFSRDLVEKGAESVRVERDSQLRPDGTGQDRFLVMAGNRLSQTEAETLREILETWGYPSEITTVTADPPLVFDYTITGGETIREMLPDFEYIHPFTRLVWEEQNYILALHVPSSFEGEPFPGPLFLIEGSECRLLSNRVWGWDFSPDGRFIAFGQSVLVQDVGPDGQTIDSTDAVAEEWGITPERLREATFHDGFKGDGVVILLFLYDLRTREFLCTGGVGGGIVDWNENGVIFNRIPDGWIGPPADQWQCYDPASGTVSLLPQGTAIAAAERRSFNSSVDQEEVIIIDRFPEVVNQIVIERSGEHHYVYWRHGS